ncbi:MAE_28990/MAE_18760 family HEPN-like nuclease [Candidatus Halobeggiatoa sp. HSG11]|nr:MAE_28990/MAE_18760 family HEPN-like nuclease [Candidatus Halobeggiatoa sp. HSG11]
MIDTLQDFNRRVDEIEIYFNFLEDIVNKTPKLFYPDTKEYKPIAQEMTKILKANGFLLLYNLVESSFKKAIEEIYVELDNKNVTYEDIREELKKVVLKNFKDCNTDKLLLSKVTNISIDIVSKCFDSEKIISGNLDARKIKDFAKNYGFSYETNARITKNGSELETVKIKRNDLAHGIFSFCDCGKDYTIEDLLKIKQEVISYLREILQNIERYINTESYRKSNET